MGNVRFDVADAEFGMAVYMAAVAKKSTVVRAKFNCRMAGVVGLHQWFLGRLIPAAGWLRAGHVRVPRAARCRASFVRLVGVVRGQYTGHLQLRDYGWRVRRRQCDSIPGVAKCPAVRVPIPVAPAVRKDNSTNPQLSAAPCVKNSTGEIQAVLELRQIIDKTVVCAKPCYSYR